MYNYLTKNKEHLQEKQNKTNIWKDVFAGLSAIYVKHFETKEI